MSYIEHRGSSMKKTFSSPNPITKKLLVYIRLLNIYPLEKCVQEEFRERAGTGSGPEPPLRSC
jgi:hypothetical protein